MLSPYLVLSFFAPLVLGKTTAPNLQLHEAVDNVPVDFVLSGPAAPDTVLNLRLALVQNNVSGLVDELYSVSDPSSANYGQYLSKEEVEALVAPSLDSVTAVNSWLSLNGLDATIASPAGDWLAVQVPVSKANEILSANYSVFTHVGTGLQTVRTLAYSIPTDLVGHLDLVHPTVSFPDPYGSTHPVAFSRPVSDIDLSNTTSSCANLSSITPACIQSLYKIPSTAATNNSNRLAVTGYVGEWANEADLQASRRSCPMFLERYRPDMNSSTMFMLETVDNGSNNQTLAYAGGEANLDIQYTLGLATGVPTTFISVGGNWSTDGFLGSLLDTANYLLSQDSPPQVVSTSYGLDEKLVSQKFANTLCNAYAQLGARGVSMLFAPGDAGVAGFDHTECTTFQPTFPSTCPYVTSVGGTVGIPETAASLSAGGFSNIFPRPSYQSTAVPAYLSGLGSTDSGLYNASGRGFPDVAAYAVYYDVFIARELIAVNGTSAATPVWASVVTLLNDRLMAAGKPVLGFLNPWLYAGGASALTDIVSGNNRACANDTGFDAAVGWDPITGLGTPDFSLLQSAVGL
ncbi:hypothetical protein IEO21_03857 [Rhodonia placenta]|uniref:Peptidase S53 domain-containing protein n=1 Tax=Rhodonia placenta TaxID=104341 RepID=A0A8H7U326_9APHY|nr:hypothetical protein IEO21_03857 [Postia placenta]